MELEQVAEREESIPEGYWKSKVGVIPCDWKIGAIGSLTKTMRNPVEVDKKKEYVQLGIRSHGKGIFYKEKVTGEMLGNKRVFWVEPNCFIVNIVFAWERAIARTTDKDDGIIASHRFPMYKPLADKIVLDYLTYFFKSKRGGYVLELASPGGAGRNKTLGQSNFAKSLIPVPPLKEQKKIAEILSTQDEVIKLKEQLIEEKEKQKKYLMQVLLNPESEHFKRLDGFDDKWKTERLGNLCNISTGDKDVKDKISNGEYPFYVRSKKVERISSYSYDGEAILIPGDGKIGEVIHYIIGRFDYHQRVYKISDFNRTILGKYIYYYLQKHFRRQAHKYTAKATVDSLRMPMLTNMKIISPQSIQEQMAIINALNSINEVIIMLNRELYQEKQKKKALMQLLLTGKVRTTNLSQENNHA